MSLKEYNRKRKFDQTPEPKGKVARSKGALRFVVQLHDASRLHYDLRLEFGGVFRSWAVPKGPSLNPTESRMAVFVEDHPIAYGSFEGVIPRGNYGAGTVMLWDEGTYVERGSKGRADSEAAMLENFAKGHITFVVTGHKLNGEFALIRLKKDQDGKAWLLVKKRDAHASSKRAPLSALSVKTGRTIEEIARQSPARGDVWLPSKAEKTTKAPPRAKPTGKAVAARFPRGLKLASPLLASESFKAKGWQYETLHENGLRALVEIENGRAELYSRTRLSLRAKYPELSRALAAIPHALALDGEIVGKTFIAFDLLYVDGEDLRPLPLRERRLRLEALDIFGSSLALSKYTRDDYSKLVTNGAVLARDLESPYESGVTRSWQRFTPTIEKARDEGPRLTHLEKVYWPKEGFTKGDVVQYYRSVSSLILPHLKGRPESLNRHPNGIAQPGFFQKDMSGYLPRWIETQRVYSESSGKSINYLLCNDERTLLYMANLGCIELNPWLATVAAIEKPTLCVIDLDPDGQSMKEIVQVARTVRKVLEEIGVTDAQVKTSGGDGLHICVPLGATVDFDTSRKFAEQVCRVVQARLPKLTTVERTPAKRGGKLYLDFLQNRRGQTLASVYGLRPRAGAPVSTPLEWDELTPKLRPTDFNIRTAPKRFEKVGDLWRPMLVKVVDIERALRKLKQRQTVDDT